MNKKANISHDTFKNYTGTSIPCDYKFCCWVGDVNEKELLEAEHKNGRDMIQVVIPYEKQIDKNIPRKSLNKPNRWRRKRNGYKKQERKSKGLVDWILEW